MGKRRDKQRRRQARKAQQARAERDPSELYLKQFKLAAAEGAVIELHLRMLAEKISELERFAHAERLANVETEIIKWFGDRIDEPNATLLSRCRTLRNKLFHGDFRGARSHLHALGAPRRQGDIKMIDLRGATGGIEIMKRVVAAAEGKQDTFTLVSDSTSTAEGSIFGWLLELGNAGDLVEAARVFRRAGDLVTSLAVSVDDAEIASRRSRREPATQDRADD